MKIGSALANILFLLNIVSSFVFFVVQSPYLWALCALQACIVLYFFFADFTRFVHSLFWPMLLASLLALPWPAAFIAPIVAYLAVALPVRRMREEIHWLRAGGFNTATVMIAVPTVLLSSAALVLWVVLAKPDVSDLVRMVPYNSIAVIFAVGLVFSVFNACWEEIILKGILWDGAGLFIRSVPAIILFQAVLFGVMHLNGFPRGVIGAVLAGIYGVMIGLIRKYSDGLAAPIVVHFFADATIFGILVWLRW